ncbi:voltage-dependent calcium channel gamma-5 subunit-like [Branchiostoma floridae]|uniref:Voltage-dependent calcium channel gamma-5 subunit-like n=1 Tax=Branchiostoma floridae TaxID=7739 RepID=A0A9J7M7N7_BRAFL|nr:voltage-dependent calcium channel gamma-5 subunit-like [Branchiostoma floridae]
MFLKARKMVTCGKRPLMILTCLCSSLSLGFLVVAVGTDYWLYTAEYVMLPNKTLDVSVEVHSGLWRVCPIMANGSGMCVKISTFGAPLGKNYGPSKYTTPSIMRVISSAMPFPVVSLVMTFLGCVVSTIGHVNPRRKLNAFASGILFILSGLFTVVGLIVYISAINDEVMHRDKKNFADSSFHYQYSWSFFMAAMSFGLTELSGVLSIYLFIRLYMSDDEKARSRAVSRRAMYPSPCLSAPPTPRGSTYDHVGYPCRSLSNVNDGPYAPRSPSSTSLGGYKMRNSTNHLEGGYPFIAEYKARNPAHNPADEEGYPMSYQTAIVNRYPERLTIL